MSNFSMHVILYISNTDFNLHNERGQLIHSRNILSQGYGNRYDIIDHGHEKKTFMYIFHRSKFTEIRKFATIVLWKLVINFSV